MEVCDQLHTSATLPPGTPLIGSWVGLTASLDMMAKKRKSLSLPETNPQRSAHSLVTIMTELSQLFPDKVKR
jgi:hypothetical protein